MNFKFWGIWNLSRVHTELLGVLPQFSGWILKVKEHLSFFFRQDSERHFYFSENDGKIEERVYCRITARLHSKTCRKVVFFLTSGEFSRRNMTLKYSQRSLVVLALLGILSAIMTGLSMVLIFQLQSQQTVAKGSLASSSTIIPAHLWLPVSTVLAALSLTLNMSSVVVCLLHSYCSTEVCRSAQDTER